MSDVIRVYSIMEDGKEISRESWNSNIINYDSFKNNRKLIYGKDIVFVFKFCFIK
jgi:hypothetical protein